jgi:hypothetical protein
MSSPPRAFGSMMPSTLDHGRKVGSGVISRDGIDAHPRRHGTIGAREPADDLGPGKRAALGYDGVLQVEDDRVRARCRGLRKQLRAVTRHEQHRSHHASALRFMSAVRLQEATSSPR